MLSSRVGCRRRVVGLEHWAGEGGREGDICIHVNLFLDVIGRSVTSPCEGKLYSTILRVTSPLLNQMEPLI